MKNESLMYATLLCSLEAFSLEKYFSSLNDTLSCFGIFIPRILFEKLGRILSHPRFPPFLSIG
jgi:hypothetical protein